MTEEITFTRACDKIPWGFRLTGGVDFSCPLTVSRVTGNSIAEKRGLKVGDIITEIGNKKTVHLTHVDAQNLIIGAKNSLKLSVLRGSYPDVTRALTPVRGLIPSLPINIEKKKTVSTASVNSVNSLFDDDSFEFLGQSDDDFSEEKREPTEEQIEQMLLENAEVIEEKGKTTIGVNFHRFMPKCDFIKDSAVFQILQEEQVRKELSEKEQLQKYPNKRFSTFLLPPDRPVPAPKSNSVKERKNITKENAFSLRKATKENETNLICDSCVQPDYCTNKNESQLKIEVDECTTITDKDCTEHTNQINQSQNNFVSESPVEKKCDTLECNYIETANMQVVLNESNQLQIEEIREDESQNISKYETDYENQLKDIKNTLNALGQLPALIQAQLDTIQTQLKSLLKVKEAEESSIEIPETNQIAMINEGCDCLVQFQLNADEIQETKENKTLENENENTLQEHEHEDQEKKPEENLSYELHEMNEINFACEESENKNFEEQDFERRHACPLTPLPRPMVLPGGRIWRKPKDAFNEEFIAETLISQAEVLVGSTLGVNFRKYETPKIDYSNSAVYKLVHDLDSKKSGLTDRDVIPALQDYYQSPISARHFYCASLAEKARLANQQKDVENN